MKRTRKILIQGSFKSQERCFQENCIIHLNKEYIITQMIFSETIQTSIAGKYNAVKNKYTVR